MKKAIALTPPSRIALEYHRPIIFRDELSQKTTMKEYAQLYNIEPPIMREKICALYDIKGNKIGYIYEYFSKNVSVEDFFTLNYNKIKSALIQPIYYETNPLKRLINYLFNKK